MLCGTQRTCLQVPKAQATTKAPSSRVLTQSVQHAKLQKRCRRCVCAAAENGSGIQGNALFANNPQFAAAFQQAVSRQGDDAVFSGAPVPKPEEIPSPHEEMLMTSLRQSRRNILSFEKMQKALQKAQESEEQQFERIHFAYRKVKAENAYIRQLERRLAEEKAKNNSRY